MPLSRRAFMTACSSALVSGCVKNPVLENAYTTFRSAFFDDDTQPISRENSKKIPYSSMTVKIGKAPRALLILAYIDPDGTQHWYSGDRVALILKTGRLVQTVGLPDNLRSQRTEGGDPLADSPHKISTPVISERIMEIESGGQRRYLPIRAALHNRGRVKLRILEIDFETVLLEEVNTYETGNWSFTNRFWADAYDGFIWKSEQVISRRLPPLNIEIIKPPAA